MDNVFVIALIFAYFRCRRSTSIACSSGAFLGALVMRGVMIAPGAALITRFTGCSTCSGRFLLFTGIKMIFTRNDDVHPEKNPRGPRSAEALSRGSGL